jgi:2,3-diaminopropionate biosynthesis protein SbnB
MIPTLYYLSDREISRILTPELTIKAVSLALDCHARGDFEQPLKPYLYPLGRDHVDKGGRFITMPARLGDPFHCAGVKHIAGFPSNRNRGLPRASGLIILNDIETGFPMAVMDCARISASRTASIAALSYQYLGPSRPGHVAICGAGAIAAACIDAMSALDCPPCGFSLYDLDKTRAEQLAVELTAPGRPPIRACDQARTCVEGAEVLITATTAKEAYLRRDWLADCRLVVALSFEDCEPGVLLASKVVVDDWDQCCREDKPIHRLTRAGLFSRERVHGELSEIVTGRRFGRESEDELVYVNPMGMAIEDLAVAWMVFQAATGSGLGLALPA